MLKRYDYCITREGIEKHSSIVLKELGFTVVNGKKAVKDVYSVEIVEGGKYKVSYYGDVEFHYNFQKVYDFIMKYLDRDSEYENSVRSYGGENSMIYLHSYLNQDFDNIYNMTLAELISKHPVQKRKGFRR